MSDADDRVQPEGSQPPRHRANYTGYLDGVENGMAKGWAYDSAQPTEPVRVEIWCDGECVVVGTADIFREDLQRAGIGDGRVHFAVPLPASLRDGQEHVVAVRIPGMDAFLPEPVAVILPRAPLQAQVESIEGATLRAILKSEAAEWTQVDLFADEIRIAAFDAQPGVRAPVSCELPTEYLDGGVHWFCFRTHEDGALIGQSAHITPIVSTPEEALQAYARNFRPILSASALRRYASLERQFALAPRHVAAQAPGPDRLDLAAQLEMIVRAHAQVMYGVQERPGKAEPLTLMQFEKPRVSVVIPAHNKFWVTYNCIASLILAPNETTAEYILVDDGSKDETTEIETLVKGLKVVRHTTGEGFVRASNAGASVARGEFVVMLNNDTEVCAGWLDELIYVYNHFPEVGLVGSKFIYPNGKLQEAGGIIFPNFDAWNYGRQQNPYDPRFNYIRQVDYCSGACIMLRRETWEQLKGFDEYYSPAYYEDTDLAFRVRAMGLKTYYTPFSEIIHFEGVSSGTSTSSGVKRFQAINEPKFRSRWASTIRRFSNTLDPHIAKDRGASLRALVIDAQPPRADRDAGSYAAVQEMRLLQALGVKLTFIPQNLAYLGNYTEALQRMGVECLFAPYQTSIDGVIEERGGEFDFFYITRYAVAERYIDVIRRVAPHAKIVFCNADLHFLREIRAAIANDDPEKMQEAARTREAELEVMRRTDVTLSYTDTEAAVIASHNLDQTRVMKCPWVVEVDAAPPTFGDREGIAFLGNYQHPPNEEAVVHFINNILPELRREMPEIRLHVYGSQLPEKIRKLAGEGVVIGGYVEDVAEVYNTCRVFVAPLRSGAGLKGKVVGALAAGVPSVISPLAAEGVGVNNGSEAMIAETRDEWVEAIAALYRDEARWTEMSKRAREFVGRQYSFDVGVKRMRAALAAAGVYAD